MKKIKEILETIKVGRQAMDMSYTTAVVNGEHNSEAVEVGVNLVVGAVCQVVAFKKAPKATIAVTAVGAAVNLYAAYRKGKKVQSNTSL